MAAQPVVGKGTHRSLCNQVACDGRPKDPSGRLEELLELAAIEITDQSEGMQAALE